ncbi:extended synaptotagmin-3 isoform X2 [Rana temporaria]|uniref:extended synaptotagmin-3 isoform X2 n=1 Tax=Rana temporaria TaxID=8407 RepID=UPI001AAC65DC|nr:extended synaptotagmin-3 isoform X2 [Rana temporaria]
MSVPGQQSRVSGDPQHTRGIRDPQNTRAMTDPQQKRGPGDPQQTPRMDDPPKSQSESHPVSGDPQQSPAESHPKKRLSDDPQFKFGDPQIRAMGDPVLAVVRTVARVLLLLVPVYVVGRLGLSVTWLLLGLFLWTFWNRNKKSKLARLRAAWELLDNECLEVTRGLNGQQMPAWVNFPDVDRVEWINKIVKQMWPYFGMYMEKLFHEKIEPLVRASNDHMKAFTFTKVNFGDKSPRINGVKVYTKQVDKREVILDLQLCYSGDCEINVEVKKLCKAGVKGLQIHGTLRVILAPLMSDVPFIGAVTFFFIQKPFLDINWTGLTNLLEIPGVNDMSDGMIVDLIASYLVLPNRFTFPLCSQVNAAELRFPVPHGVLRAYLYEAENLIPKDTYLRGLIKGKSDPYAVLRVGNQTYKSKTIQENLNPLWNEMYEFVVHEVPGQDLEIDVYDEDPDKDDFLGSLVINLEGVMKDRVVDEWFPLCDVVSGTVHLKLEWHSLLANPEKLCEAGNGMTIAMVIVYLDSAGGLPKNHFEYSNNEYSGIGQRYTAHSMQSEKEPTSYVVMSLGKKTVKSKTCSTTKDPVWEQAFSFFIQDVHTQHLQLEVKDNTRQCSLGMLNFPLHRVLTMDGLTADQKFPLTNSGPNSFIKMKVVLRVLQIEDPDPDSVYAGINSLKHGPVSIKRANQDKPHKKPQSTSDAPQNQGHCVQQNKVTPQQNKVTPQNKVAPQHKAIPQNKVLRRDSSLSSTHRVYQTAPDQNQQANQNAGNGAAASAPQTPKLRHLQRIAPSLMSLNSLASSVFDLNEDFGGTGLLLGEINISIRYASLRHCLIVSVNGCRNLIQCSNHGADPYVRIYLLPDRRWANRKKTSVKRKTLHPIYNERFEFLVSLEDAKKRMLDVAVKNNRQFGSHERKEMGKVLVDLSRMDVDQGITDWFELTANGYPTS